MNFRKSSKIPFRTFPRIHLFGGAKKTIQETSSQSVCERAVFEPNLLNQSSKQRTGCAISYLLESKLAQYLIQNYHQPSEILIVSPHILLTLPILLSLFTILMLLTLLALLKLPILPKVISDNSWCFNKSALPQIQRRKRDAGCALLSFRWIGKKNTLN